MKDKKNIFLGLLIVASLMLTVGCTTSVEESNDDDNGGGGGTSSTTVNYNAGIGNTSGTVPVDSTKYNVGDEVTVLGNPGDLKGEIIYDTTKMQLLGWNTLANGAGDMYYEGNAFIITEDITLYAIYNALRIEGPAGGLIFYDAGSTQSWGRYLEAWTADESGTYKWKTSKTSTAGTSTAIGFGYDNTYTAMAGAEHLAAFVVRTANHGGFNDWFLPSKDELNQMYINLKLKDVGGVTDFEYWSSSEYDSEDTWIQLFSNGSQFNRIKLWDSNHVRAVRAF